MEKFYFETFVNLMATSPKKAIEYRDRCHQNTKSNAEVEQINERVSIEKNEEVTSTGVDPKDFTEDEDEVKDGEKVDFTREDLISKLKKASITVNPRSKDETLLRKCIENNLI